MWSARPFERHHAALKDAALKDASLISWKLPMAMHYHSSRPRQPVAAKQQSRTNQDTLSARPLFANLENPVVAYCIANLTSLASTPNLDSAHIKLSSVALGIFLEE
jgi:hypothetical protein